MKESKSAETPAILRPIPESIESGVAEPTYPILSIEEVRLPDGTIPDLRDQLDEELRSALTDDDHVIHIVTPEFKKNHLTPSSIREILRLTNSTSQESIGDNGAAVASLASHANKDNPALRKFEVIHGRDSLEIAAKLHREYPKLLKETIKSLAKTQGVVDETWQPDQPFRQEEAGRIILLDRPATDPISQKFSKYLNWGWPFYGSIDATPSFVSAIATYAREYDSLFLDETYPSRSGETATIADALDLSVNWIENKIAASPAGFLEFYNADPKGGIAAQSWKDSAFAYVHADGSRANHTRGIASVEVQSRTYDALVDAADIYRGHSDFERAAQLDKTAGELRQRVLDTFWIEDEDKGNYVAMATDYDDEGNLRTLNVRSSNMGHLLNSRILDGDDEQTTAMREAIVSQLFTPELLCAAGIRTLASDEAAFRAGGYHTGSSWLWDTAFTADGLERHDYHHLAWNLRQRIVNVVNTRGDFPEFVRGDFGETIETNPAEVYVWNEQFNVLHLFEQPPQEVQGWTVSATLAIKRNYLNYLSEHANSPSQGLEKEILQRFTPKDS